MTELKLKAYYNNESDTDKARIYLYDYVLFGDLVQDFLGARPMKLVDIDNSNFPYKAENGKDYQMICVLEEVE